MKLLKSKGQIISLVLMSALVAGGIWYYSGEPPAKSTQNYRDTTVNAVIGDQSFIDKYGKKPGPGISETKRIKTHLKYVRDRLAEKSVVHLTAEERQNRMKNLNRLSNYIQQGAFPVNEEYHGQRRPNFIDSEGRICAVGYLIAQSEGLKAAERIKSKYQYAYVRDMDSQYLTDWAEQNGFTQRELAMIQPAYDFEDPKSHQVEKVNRPLEILGLGASTGLSTINMVQGFTNSSHTLPAVSGIASGAALFTLGVTRYANYSEADMIIGGASIAAGTWGIYRLLHPQRYEKQQKLSMGLVPSDLYEKNIGIYMNVRF